MTIGLVSDTHGWLDPALLEHFRGAALIVHAGDVGDGRVLEQLAAVAPVLAVRGNIDSGALRDLPLAGVAEVAGVRIAALHVAGSPLRPNADAQAILDGERPDVLVVGHSHVPVAGRVDGVTWVNPGAAGHEGPHRDRTAGLIRIGPDGQITHLRVHLGRRGRGAAG